MKKIAIGADHGGFDLKNAVVKHLTERGIEFKDFGTYTDDSCDYPDYGEIIGRAVSSGEFDAGIAICGTGVGISITANKIHGIRAALCTDCFTAEATRQHNDANVLCMGGRVVGEGLALKIVDTFIDTPFSNGERHIRRIEKISSLDDERGK